MENNLHLWFSAYPEKKKFKGIIKQLGFEKARVMAFPFRLGCHNLPHEFTSKAIMSEYYDSVCNHVYESGVKKFINHDFSQYDNIYLWKGNDLNSHLMIMSMCKIYKGKMTIVDASGLCEYAQSEYKPTKDYPQLDYGIGSLNPQLIKNYKEHIPLINLTQELRKDYCQKWDDLVRNDTGLRVLEDNEVINIPSDSFDDIIIANAKKNNDYIRATWYCFLDADDYSAVNKYSQKYYLDSNSYDFIYLYHRLLELSKQGKFLLRQSESFYDGDIYMGMIRADDFIQKVFIRAHRFVEAKPSL